MKYMGSKNRIAKHILPIVLKDRKEGQYYVEPFVGGANIIDKVDGNRIGGDSNTYLIALLQSMSLNWFPPKYVDREEYKYIKDNQAFLAKNLVGWAGFMCSYSGKWFGGFAGKTQTKEGIRNYQEEARRNYFKQVQNVKGMKFVESYYDTLGIPPNSIIYCDPPYENTTNYKDKFNHEDFWQWCRDKKEEGHTVFISEYEAPKDFVCVWQKEVSSSLSANGKSGSSKKSIEKLFTIN